MCRERLERHATTVWMLHAVRIDKQSVDTEVHGRLFEVLRRNLVKERLTFWYTSRYGQAAVVALSGTSRTDAKRHRVGFVPSKDLKPKERFVLGED